MELRSSKMDVSRKKPGQGYRASLQIESKICGDSPQSKACALTIRPTSPPGPADPSGEILALLKPIEICYSPYRPGISRIGA